MVRSARSRKRLRDGMLAFLGVGALGLAAFFAMHEPRNRPVRLRMTAGQDVGTRHRIAEELRKEALRQGISIDLRPTAGSEEALRALESGRVEVALVQGGLEMGDMPDIRQAAGLHAEPLHLLVKEEIHQGVTRNLAGLRGKVVNLGELGSGSYLLSGEVMAFSGLRPGADFVASHLGYADLERETERSRLPDAIFTVSTLPSPVVRHLVTKHGYRLVALPFFEAFTLGALDREPTPPRRSGETATRIDRRHVYDSTIPAFVYEVEPGVPPEPIHTLGTRLLLVARRDVASDSVRRLLDVVFNSPFAQVIHPPLDARLLDLPPELPWHDGTADYVRRNSPLIAGDVIDLVEKEVSILGVVAGGIFCLVQWLRRRYRWRRERGFEAYILQVAEVERQALALSRAPTLDLPSLLQLQEDLIRIKGEALQRFADGELDGEELMSGFLAHVSDARDFLIRLILHERDNLEDQARAQRRPAEALWVEAVGVRARPAEDSEAGDGQGAAAGPQPAHHPVEEPGRVAGEGLSEVQEGGTTVLRGAVPATAAGDRAVVLARDTVGVTQVIDELVVAPNVRVVPGPSASPSPTGTATVTKPARVVPAPAGVTETTTTKP
jgi:TRAP-type uncharacterized transport system substrate-binding protein